MKAALQSQTTAIPSNRINIDPETGCWVWLGTRQSDGYGLVTVREQREYVHRAMFQLFVGPVGNNRELDHLCQNRLCCNPWHLEAVSSRENSLRGNHPLFMAHRERRCRKGHDLSIEANVARRADGRARCRICRDQYQRDRRAKLREAAA